VQIVHRVIGVPTQELFCTGGVIVHGFASAEADPENAAVSVPAVGFGMILHILQIHRKQDAVRISSKKAGVFC